MTLPRRAWAPAAALVAGGVVTGLAAADLGGRGALSAALGTAVVVGFFAAGALPLLLVRGQEARAGLGAAVLLLNYTLRLALAVLVLRAAGRSDDVEPRWTTAAVLAGALAWAGAQALAVLRAAAGAGHDRAGHGPREGDG